MSDNQKLLDEFTAYCKANPSMRFWQALRNWSGFSAIYAVPVNNAHFDAPGSLLDTFYWRGRDG